MESFHNRSGLTVLAEFGEKLFLMLICARWLAEHSTPLIAETMKALSSEFIRRFNHPDNAYLTHFDHVFNEVGNLLSKFNFKEIYLFLTIIILESHPF